MNVMKTFMNVVQKYMCHIISSILNEMKTHSFPFYRWKVWLRELLPGLHKVRGTQCGSWLWNPYFPLRACRTYHSILLHGCQRTSAIISFQFMLTESNYIFFESLEELGIYMKIFEKLIIFCMYMLVKFSLFSTAINPKESGNEIISSHLFWIYHLFRFHMRNIV